MIARIPAAILICMACLVVSCMVFVKELNGPHYGGDAWFVAGISAVALLVLSATAIGRSLFRLHRATEAQARPHLGTIILGTIGFLASAFAMVFLALNFFI